MTYSNLSYREAEFSEKTSQGQTYPGDEDLFIAQIWCLGIALASNKRVIQFDTPFMINDTICDALAIFWREKNVQKLVSGSVNNLA